MPISYDIELHDIEALTWAMWDACSVDCPAMIGAPCPTQSRYMDGPADAKHFRKGCPGWSAKFTNAATEVIYTWTLGSGQSEECGNTDHGGWYALFRNPDKGEHGGPMGAGVILTAGSSGSCNATRFATTEEMEKEWAGLLRETRECPYENDCAYDELCEQCTDDEEI